MLELGLTMAVTHTASQLKHSSKVKVGYLAHSCQVEAVKTMNGSRSFVSFGTANDESLGDPRTDEVVKLICIYMRSRYIQVYAPGSTILYTIQLRDCAEKND